MNITTIMCTRRAYALSGGAPKWEHRTISEHRNKCRGKFYLFPHLFPWCAMAIITLLLSAATITRGRFDDSGFP